MSSGELAGTLAERLTLLTRAATRDDLGGASGAWNAGATLWAAIRPDGAGAEGQGDVPGVRLRWRATVRASVATIRAERVLWNGRTLRVRRVEADPGMPDRIVLLLEEEA